MKKNSQRSGLVVGAGLMLGIGVGFFLLTYSALAFIGSIFIGLGLGLLVGAMMSKEDKQLKK